MENAPYSRRHNTYHYPCYDVKDSTKSIREIYLDAIYVST